MQEGPQTRPNSCALGTVWGNTADEEDEGQSKRFCVIGDGHADVVDRRLGCIIKPSCVAARQAAAADVEKFCVRNSHERDRACGASVPTVFSTSQGGGCRDSGYYSAVVETHHVRNECVDRGAARRGGQCVCSLAHLPTTGARCSSRRLEKERCGRRRAGMEERVRERKQRALDGMLVSCAFRRILDSSACFRISRTILRSSLGERTHATLLPLVQLSLVEGVGGAKWQF